MLRKIFLILILVISNNIFLISQDTQEQNTEMANTSKKDTVSNWKSGGYTSLNFNQVSLIDWAKGGESSFSATGIVNLFLNYKEGRNLWENTIDLNYGILKSEDYPIRKNQDKIDISSKFGYEAYEKLYYSGLINFKSQFAPGYNYPNDSVIVSKFFAPAYLIISIGMDYQPSDIFSIYLSPITGNLIFVQDQALADIGSYGVEKAVYDSLGNIIKNGKQFKPDFGAYLRTRIKTDIMKNINLESKLELFNNYTDKNVRNRMNIDVDWETMLVMKVNEFISANIFIHLIYDHDILVPIYRRINGVKTIIGEGRRMQIKEVLGIGFSYKF